LKETQGGDKIPGWLRLEANMKTVRLSYIYIICGGGALVGGRGVRSRLRGMERGKGKEVFSVFILGV